MGLAFFHSNSSDWDRLTECLALIEFIQASYKIEGSELIPV